LLARDRLLLHIRCMFTVDEAIRQAYHESGELAGVVEFRRHFPMVADGALARDCVRRIVGWRLPVEPADERK